MEDDRPSFLPVLGMHRSGTSAVAGLLKLLGAEIGPDEQLIPPSDENPKGFFEHLAVVRLNESVLVNAGGSWEQPPLLSSTLGEGEFDADMRKDARRILDDLTTAASGRPVAIKDPRLCLTLPLWIQVGNPRASVICIRHPGSVAGSLLKRNGIPPTMGAQLWLRYASAAFRNVGTIPSYIVVYERLLAEPIREAQTLAATLGLPEPVGDAATAVHSFLDRKLNRNHRGQLVNSDALEARLAVAAYDLLRTVGGEASARLVELLGDADQQGREGLLGVRSMALGTNAPDAAPTVATSDRETVIGSRDVGVKSSVSFPIKAPMALPYVEKDEFDASEPGDPKAGPLPSFLIIGAQKSATRWLRTNLDLHPEICVAPRELEFFVGNWRRGVDWYRSQFSECRHAKAVGEATPGYMMWHHRPAQQAKRIYELLGPACRLIAMLRNPIDRTYSAYVHFLSEGRIDPQESLVEYVKSVPPDADPWSLVAGSWYGASLEPFLDRFGQGVLVLLQEDIVDRPAEVYARAVEHVGAASEFIPDGLERIRYSNSLPRESVHARPDGSRRPLSAVERDVLWEYFELDVERLSLLTGLDLSLWAP